MADKPKDRQQLSQDGPGERPNRVPRRRRSRALRAVLALLILLTIVLAAGFWKLRKETSPERVKEIVLGYLQPLTTGTVAIGDVEVSWLSAVRLFDVTLTPAGDHLAALELPEIEVSYDLWSLLAGRQGIRAASARQPRLRIIRNTATGDTNLSGLYVPPSEQTLMSFDHLPSIALNDLGIEVIDRRDGEEHLIDEMTISLRGVPTGRPYEAYEVAWQGMDERIASGRSRWDLRDARLQNIRGGIPWLSLDAVVATFSSRFDKAAGWCDLFGIGGNFRVTDYDLCLAPCDRSGQFAEIALADASLSIPFDETDRRTPAEERYLRFTNVDGRIRIEGARLTAAFSGLHRGSRCQVTFLFEDGLNGAKTLEEAAFTLEASAESLTLPKLSDPNEARFVQSWKPLTVFYRDYDPHGKVDVTLHLSKDEGADRTVALRHMTLTGLGVEAQCRWLPIPVDDVRGTVEFMPEGVFLRNLSARRRDTLFTVSGWLEKPKPWSEGRLHIVARNLELDHELVTALPRSFRSVAERFNVSGRSDFTCDLFRPRGEVGTRPRWNPHLVMAFENLAACYDGMPYAVDGLAGDVVIDETHVQVEHVTTSMKGLDLVVDGACDFSPSGGALDFDVAGRNVAVDSRLIQALPDKLRRDVQAFRPRGRMDVTCDVHRDGEDDPVRAVANVALRGGRMTPPSFPVEFTDVSADLRIDGDSLLVTRASGRHRSCRVDATAELADDRTRFAATFDGLVLDEVVTQKLPEPVGGVVRDLDVQGALGGSLTYATGAGPGAAPKYEAEITLNGVAVTHKSIPQGLRNVTGTLHIDPTGVRASGLTARLARADVRGDVTITEAQGRIDLTANGVDLAEALESLPAPLRATWRAKSPAGVVDLAPLSLIYNSRQGEPRWTVDGRATLHDITLQQEPALSGLTGELSIAGALADAEGGTSLSGQLSVPVVDLLDWRLQELAGNWVFAKVADGKGAFKLREVTGRAYGGPVAGELDLRFDRIQSDYRLTLTAHDVDVKQILDTMADPEENPPEDVHGKADVHLYLSAESGNDQSRRGGGHVEIRNGRLYRLPVILAILEVLNLSVPREKAIQNGSAEFFIVGNKLELEEILLEGDGVALVGSGEMRLPSKGVDIKLVSVSPHEWMRVPALSSVVEGASRGIVEIHVVGPVTRPIVRPRPFSGIRDELKRLFKKRERKKPGKKL